MAGVFSHNLSGGSTASQLCALTSFSLIPTRSFKRTQLCGFRAIAARAEIVWTYPDRNSTIVRILAVDIGLLLILYGGFFSTSPPPLLLMGCGKSYPIHIRAFVYYSTYRFLCFS